MDLTNLSRGELAELQHRLLTVSSAADVLAEGGLEPVIDLTETETRLRTGPVREMPAAAPPVETGPDLADRVRAALAPAIEAWSDFEQRPWTAAPELPGAWYAADYAAASAEDPGPVLIDDLAVPEMPAEAPEALDAAEGPVEDAQVALLEEALATEDPEPASPAPEPPAVAMGTAAAVEAPVSPGGNPPAGADAGIKYGLTWTEDDDARVVAGVAERMAAGLSATAAAKEVAVLIGRTPASTVNRASMLKDRIAAARGLAGDEAAPPMQPVSEAAARVVEEVRAKREASAGVVRPVAPSHLAGEHLRIWTALDALPAEPPFDPETDLALYDAYDGGGGVNALALDLGVDSAALIRRFREMTRCISNDKGKLRPELKMKFSAVIRWRAKAFAEARAA